jgi:hypothetical protein
VRGSACSVLLCTSRRSSAPRAGGNGVRADRKRGTLPGRPRGEPGRRVGRRYVAGRQDAHVTPPVPHTAHLQPLQGLGIGSGAINHALVVVVVWTAWCRFGLTAMPSILPTASIDSLLEALDAADTAVRNIYRALADDPDLAPARDAELRDLHSKRVELSRRIGMAALTEWRAVRAAVQPVANNSTETASPDQSTTEVALDREATGVVACTPSELEPHPGATDPPASAPLASPAPSSAPLPPEPASNAQLAQWKQTVHSEGLGATTLTSPAASRAPAVQRPWPVTLHEMMCILGPRETELGDPFALADELDALDEVATPERQAQWVRFPIEVQKHWLAHLVARTRAMRDHPSSETVLGRLKRVRAVYPEWAREYVPGHINGLQLKHAPVRETWASDADEHWQALVAALGHELPAARKTPPTRKRRERPVVEVEPTFVEADWPLLPLLRGKTAVIVGGAPKEPNRDRLETYLRLATLDWPLVDGPRRVEAVAQRIAKGAYDLVIVNQAMISHPEAERVLDAAKASRTRWAMVDGYGATAVRQGLDRFLKPAKAG